MSSSKSFFPTTSSVLLRESPSLYGKLLIFLYLTLKPRSVTGAFLFENILVLVLELVEQLFDICKALLHFPDHLLHNLRLLLDHPGYAATLLTIVGVHSPKEVLQLCLHLNLGDVGRLNGAVPALNGDYIAHEGNISVYAVVFFQSFLLLFLLLFFF